MDKKYYVYEINDTPDGTFIIEEEPMCEEDMMMTSYHGVYDSKDEAQDEIDNIDEGRHGWERFIIDNM